MTLLPPPARRALYQTLIAVLLPLSIACSPTLNWREVRGVEHPFKVLLPAKPATLTREIDLDGTRIAMQMTAAQAGGMTFAVGSATLPAGLAAEKALAAMQTALLRNIGAEATARPGRDAGPVLQAEGKNAAGRPVKLFARFAARGQEVYQAVLIGDAQAATPEVVETFLASFVPGE